MSEYSYEIEERAAIAQYDGNLSPEEALALALERAKLEEQHLVEFKKILPIKP